MANNTIVINFQPCEPAPADGYLVKYRPQGSTGPYRTHPERFTSSPAIIFSTVDPADTSYEGTIQGDCGGGKLGVPVRWYANNQESGSESESLEPGPGECFRYERQRLESTDSGYITGNSNVLNGMASLNITKLDYDGNNVNSILSGLGPGDQVEIRLLSDPGQYALYDITGVIFELADSWAYNISLVSGTGHVMTGGELYRVCLVELG